MCVHIHVLPAKLNFVKGFLQCHHPDISLWGWKIILVNHHCNNGYTLKVFSDLNHSHFGEPQMSSWMSDSTKLHFLCIVGPKKERKKEKTCRGCRVYIVGVCCNIHIWFCKCLNRIFWYCSLSTRNLQLFYTILESQSKRQCVKESVGPHVMLSTIVSRS